jgi:hypothetical protein
LLKLKFQFCLFFSSFLCQLLQFFFLFLDFLYKSLSFQFSLDFRVQLIFMSLFLSIFNSFLFLL